MRLKRFLLPLAVIAGCSCWSSTLGGLKFVPIYEAITIKAQKNSPAYVAFEEVLESERKHSEWAHLEKIKPLNLAAEKISAPLYAKKIELKEMVFQKNGERILAAETMTASAQPSSYSATVQPPVEMSTEPGDDWMEQLPRAQAQRLQEAQRRSEVMSSNWQGETFNEMAKEVLEKSGALAPSAPINNVYVAGSVNGQTKTDLPRGDVIVRSDTGGKQPTLPVDPSPAESAGWKSLSSKTDVPEPARSLLGGTTAIVGPLEITGGLAVTNEHHIEIRRSDEGILKELGGVDLQKGLYNIEVEDTNGTVLARLVNKDGKILGEGSFRLNRVAMAQTKSVQGPKIKIEPHPDFAGIVASAYTGKANDTAPAQTRVTFVKGASEATPKKDGYVAMDNVMKGSSTVMRAAAPKHLQTASIITSGQEFRTQLYPESMIKALQDIVSQQRATSLEGAPTIVWGRVSLDGKSVAGIDVNVESDSSQEAIYFNDFMIPDPKLKTTSANGLFAFVDVTPGFHSLLATRGNAIFAYQNVVVESGSVAQGDLESTIKSETVPLRVYDAFTGEARSATVTMQSLSEDLNVQNGVTTVTLPHVSRLGMMRVQPEGNDYVAARYLYNDSDAFVHIPLVHWSWLSTIKSYLRLDDSPSAGLIVGFVPDEDFEVYLAAYDNFEARQIVYFDMQGRILQNRKGMAGGGFILYNVPEDTHEVVVVGTRTQKIYSKVLPVDANSLSVLNFRE